MEKYGKMWSVKNKMHIIEKLKIILNKDNPIILEIGCANGLDSLVFLNQFKDIELFCFEPDPRNINVFKERVKDNRCKLFEIAIGSEDKEIDFHQSSGRPSTEPIGTDWALSGSLKRPKAHLASHLWCKFNKIIKVSCQKLDTWTRENNVNFIDLIWADVNGAEKDLIDGGKETFSITKYIYTEFGPDNIELYEEGINKNTIKSLLPDFEEILINDNNILLKNKNI